MEATTTSTWKQAIRVLEGVLIKYRNVKSLMTDMCRPFIVHALDADHRVLFFIFLSCMSSKCNIETVKQIIECNVDNHPNIIILYQGSITSSARRVMEQIPFYRVQWFDIAELQFDITEHEWFCPHRRLSSEEVHRLVQEIGAGKKSCLHDLPKLLTTDPVVKWLGFEKGDVIEVRRKRGEPIAYRLVR